MLIIKEIQYCQIALQVVSGGLDNDIKIWDLRKAELETTVKGHTDTITGTILRNGVIPFPAL